MTVQEAMEYCRLRAAGAGLFEADKQEALRWYQAYEELRNSVNAGYAKWPLIALLDTTARKAGLT